MKEQFADQANEYVNFLEEKYLLDLILELSEAEHRAEACGCPTCKKKPDTYRGMIEDETNRLGPRSIVLYESKPAGARVYEKKSGGL